MCGNKQPYHFRIGQNKKKMDKLSFLRLLLSKFPLNAVLKESAAFLVNFFCSVSQTGTEWKTQDSFFFFLEMFYPKDKIKGSLIRSDKHVIIGDHKAWNGSISSIIQEIGFLASQDTKQHRPPDGNALAARPHVGDTLLLYHLHLRVRPHLCLCCDFLKVEGLAIIPLGL